MIRISVQKELEIDIVKFKLKLDIMSKLQTNIYFRMSGNFRNASRKKGLIPIDDSRKVLYFDPLRIYDLEADTTVFLCTVLSNSLVKVLVELINLGMIGNDHGKIAVDYFCQTFENPSKIGREPKEITVPFIYYVLNNFLSIRIC